MQRRHRKPGNWALMSTTCRCLCKMVPLGALYPHTHTHRAQNNVWGEGAGQKGNGIDEAIQRWCDSGSRWLLCVPRADVGREGEMNGGSEGGQMCSRTELRDRWGDWDSDHEHTGGGGETREIYRYASVVTPLLFPSSLSSRPCSHTHTHTHTQSSAARWSSMPSMSHQTPPACQEDVWMQRPTTYTHKYIHTPVHTQLQGCMHKLQNKTTQLSLALSLSLTHTHTRI